jgi:hypothetical protein
MAAPPPPPRLNLSGGPMPGYGFSSNPTNYRPPPPPRLNLRGGPMPGYGFSAANPRAVHQSPFSGRGAYSPRPAASQPMVPRFGPGKPMGGKSRRNRGNRKSRRNRRNTMRR